MGLGLGFGLSIGSGGGRRPALLQFLHNGFATPDTYTSGALYVEDYLGNLVTAGADKLAIPGMRLTDGTWYDTDTEGAALYPSQNVLTRQGTVRQYTGDYKGFMVQPARTNLLAAPEQFENEAWASIGTPVVTPNTDNAPDDTLTADTVADDAGTTVEGISQSITIPDGTETYTASIYIKKDSDETRFPELALNLINGTPANASVQINTKSGALGSRTSTPAAQYKITDEGDYWRLSVSSTNNASGNTSAQVVFIPARGNALGGSTSTSGSAVIWRARLEVGDFATNGVGISDATVASINSANKIRSQNQALWFRRYVSHVGQTAWALNSYSDADNEIGVLFEPSQITLRKRIDGVDYDAVTTFTHVLGFNDVQVLWSDAGVAVRASDDCGVTWTAWGTDTNPSNATLAATFELGRNGAEQLSCNATFTTSMFLPSRATLDDYQTFVEDDLAWQNIGNIKIEFNFNYSTNQNIIGDESNSLREHSIVWHPGNGKYYLITDQVPTSSEHHPNTYDTELHLWWSIDLTTWTYLGVCVPKGGGGELGQYGVASPSGAVIKDGKIYVPFSARNNSDFAGRSIGLAWSGTNPETIPWTKAATAISDTAKEDDDPAILMIDGIMHLYHRTTAPYRIVHSQSATPETPSSWTVATDVTVAPDSTAQELTAVYFDGTFVHLFVMEQGGSETGTAHLASPDPDNLNFPQYDITSRFVAPVANVYSLGHFGVVVRDNALKAFTWTVNISAPRYGIDLRLVE